MIHKDLALFKANRFFDEVPYSSCTNAIGVFLTFAWKVSKYKINDHLGRALQKKSELVAQTPGHAIGNKLCLCGPLFGFRIYDRFELHY